MNLLSDRVLENQSNSVDPISDLLKLKEKRESAEIEYAGKNIRTKLETAIGSYLKTRSNQNTKNAHRNDLNQFKVFLQQQGVFTLGDLGGKPNYMIKNWCESWLDALLTAGISKISIQRKKGALRAFFKFLNKQVPHLIIFVPPLDSKNYKTVVTRSSTKAFSRDEWRNFKTVLESRPKTYKLYIMMQTAMLLGGRKIGEILKLKWSEIDFIGKQVYIIPEKKKDDRTTKTLPLSDDLSKLLKSYRKTIRLKLTKNDFVFPDETQQRIDSKIKYYAKKATINHVVSFHSIRTSFVTWANEQGHSQSEILNATLLASPRMIRYYDQTEPLQVNSILTLNI